MFESKIDLTEVEKLADYLERNGRSALTLLEKVGEPYEIQKINDIHDTIIVNLRHKTANKIVLGCEQKNINSLTIYGELAIVPAQLVAKFKFYREGYSMYDDLYFYFFNEEKNMGNYILSFFEPSHLKVDIPHCNIAMSNITISW